MVRIKVVLFACFLCLSATPVQAQKLYDDDFANLGAVAGAAMACNLKAMLKEYNRIIDLVAAYQAVSAIQKKAFLYSYTRAIKTAFERQVSVKPLSCAEVERRFNAQPIFGTRLLSDGRLQFPDGKLISQPQWMTAAQQNQKKGR